MNYQCCIQNTSLDTAELLHRRRSLVIDERPVTFGGAGADVELPEMEGALCRLQALDGGVRLERLTDTPLRVNGMETPLDSRPLLHGGDSLEFGPYVVRLYAMREPCVQSMGTRMLLRIAQALVVLFILLQLLVVFWLPVKLTHSDMWSGAIARQRISRTLDSLQKEFKELRGANITEDACIDVLREELRRRSRYVARYSEQMTPSQRRQMQMDLQQIEWIGQRIRDGQLIQDTETVNWDEAVRRMVEKAGK